MSQRLILFSRYPTAGRSKTRLIPALGPEGAADLQRQLTEWTVFTAHRWQARSPQTEVLIATSGGTPEDWQQWLGAVEVQPQAEGDLGDRLYQAFQAAQQAGKNRTVIIGCDCPSITPDHLTAAFQALETADVVLGPATDGGYWLIGLRQPQAQLFQDIDWGSDRVLAQTLQAAQAADLQVAQLEPLSDLDRPEDLDLWQPQPQLSVIITTLNEAANLPHTLASIGDAPVETLVVDGGSQDETVAIAKAWGAKVIHSPAGRGRQFNQGAAAAHGSLLLFLHGDTRLPPQFFNHVVQTLQSPKVVAGAFQLQIDSTDWRLRWVERGVRWRSRWLQQPYGDQALFLRRDRWRAIGGFSTGPLLEDYRLVRQLRRQGRIAVAAAAVTTSARRWQRRGVLQTTLLNQLILLGHHCGLSDQRLANWYHR
ncbi:TIGR04283 family arsenosugar biosynthesis glycosyltransferase [Synechococcus elongatus IITB7]|uniref:TIGR04283 family arsenosugar biosynthesis glycosyltransferase n=1 Tax=Synechococcus elongatus TaxID=32046 RepID=UPI0030D2F6A7